MNAVEKFFVLKGCAGLGNRLSSLAWAIGYCKNNGRTLFVDWTDGTFGKKGLNVFPRYFELQGIPHASDISQVLAEPTTTVFPALWGKHPDAAMWDIYEDDLVLLPKIQRLFLRLRTGNRWQLSNVWPARKRSADSLTVFSAIRSMRSGDWMPLMRSYSADIAEDVVYACDYNPAYDPSLFLKHVSLRADVVSMLEQRIKALAIDDRTLGIHVRQTDWKWGSGVDVLLGRLTKEVRQRQGNIFLATDSQEALDKVRKVIPEVVVISKYLPEIEDKTMGIHQLGYVRQDEALAERIFLEGLIDMYALSKCGTLWHQKGSTFSEFAHVFAKPSQTIVDWGHRP